MKIKSEKSYAIVGTTICDINNREMRQMFELKNCINDVLASHKPEAKEKKYINDDDLKLMRAILSVFTREYAATQTSAFDDELKAIDEEEKSTEKTPETPQQQETKQSLSDPYHEDQTFG